MKKLPSIWETERMIMREITEADTDFIVKLRSDPDAYKYFLYPHPLQKREHIRWFRDKYLNDDCQSGYIARLKLENCAVGVFYARQTDDCKTEVSYILAPSARGKGLATEAVFGLERLCKACTDVSAFTAQIHVDNLPSLNFINRLGYLPGERFGDFIVYRKEIKKDL